MGRWNIFSACVAMAFPLIAGEAWYFLPNYGQDVRGVETLRRKVGDAIKQIVGLSPKITLVAPGSLPRSEGKIKRVIDNRRK